MYQVQFAELTGEPYREFYEAYVPETIGKGSTSDGRIASVKCINKEAHTHSDKLASAYIYLKTGVYGCSVCGNFSAYRFLIEMVGLTGPEASATLSEYIFNSGAQKEDNFSKGYSHPPSALTKFAEECNSRLDPQIPLVNEYIRQQGITFETLFNLGVGYLPQVEGQLECLVFPYWVNGKVVALRGRTADGRKGGVKGSQFTLFNLDRSTQQTVVLCEGESDTCRVAQALERCGLSNKVGVVGAPGAQFRREWLRELEGQSQIIIIPQADQPSAAFALKAQEVLGKGRVQIVNLPWVRGEVGKDVCDWLHIHTEEELVELLPDVQTLKPFTLSHTDFLELSKQEVPWIVNNLISQGDIILLGGEQKSLKTYFTLFLTSFLAKGEPVFGVEDWKVTGKKKILFVEEEGSPILFARRVDTIIGQSGEDQVVWIHRQAVKLDVPQNLDRLKQVLKEFKPDILVLDPFTRLHSLQENESGEIKKVWEVLHTLISNHPQLAILLIHHFKKGGGNAAGWDSLRGSSVSGGEASAGIFISRDQNLTDLGHIHLSVRIDGRDLPPATIGPVPGTLELYLDPGNWGYAIGGPTGELPQIHYSSRTRPLEDQGADNGDGVRVEGWDKNAADLRASVLENSQSPVSFANLQVALKVAGWLTGEGKLRRLLKDLEAENVIKTNVTNGTRFYQVV